MLPKPSSCQGCPLYQTGKGYVPDHIQNGKVAILAQNPGADEERGQRIVGYEGPRMPIYESCDPQPLIGPTGWMLRTKYLPLAGLDPDKDVDYHNVLKCRWKNSNTLPEGELYEQAVSHCTQAHLHLQAPLIVAHGAHAWHYTQGTTEHTITDWRGFIGERTIQSKRVYATLHCADLLRDPHARFIARFDWKRLGRLVDRTWPDEIPPQTIASPTTRGAFVRRLREALEQPEIMVDTEYILDNKLLTHVGAAWKTSERTVAGFQLEWVRGQATNVERGVFMRYWPLLCRKVRMGFWNAKADLPILQENLHDIPDHIEDPMQAHAVLWPDMEHTYEFAASIYGRYNKLKHLAKNDILLYHWGDVIDLVWIWEQLKKELHDDPLCEKVYREQNLPLIPLLLDSERRGIRVNQARIQLLTPTYETLCQTALDYGGAYCGYPLNLGSSAQVCTHAQAEGIKIKSVDKDIIATQRNKYLQFDSDYEDKQGFSPEYVIERIEQGAHPLLELRVMYVKNSKILDDYLTPLSQTDTFYHEINIHTQAAGRHSVTRLGTVPPRLHDVVMPFLGEVWIRFDWDAQEPRIQQAESGSRVLKAAFEQGTDIHTQFVCLLYGWDHPKDLRDPHHSAIDAGWREAHSWGGKEDIRRRFAKETRYEINYGGDGSTAARKAIRMGIDPAVAKRAAQVLLQSDPELAAWFKKVERDVEQTHISHSWGGGRRVYYWVDSPGQAEEMKRQARNFPMQRGGTDLQNLTIVEIARTVMGVRFVYGRHDSQVWACRAEGWYDKFAEIKRIATQPRTINGVSITFPATFSVMFDDGRVEKVVEQ